MTLFAILPKCRVQNLTLFAILTICYRAILSICLVLNIANLTGANFVKSNLLSASKTLSKSRRQKVLWHWSLDAPTSGSDQVSYSSLPSARSVGAVSARAETSQGRRKRRLGRSEALKIYGQIIIWPAVAVAQLVERSFHVPEVRGSNSVIGKHLY